MRGHLGETLLTAFDRLQATYENGSTLLAGVLPDRAALHGVLAQIDALALELLEVRRTAQLTAIPVGEKKILMAESIIEPFSPKNTTVLMVDYSTGFLNSFRSHTINEHITATVALAKTAIGLKSGLVVNLGAGQRPYPQLVSALGDHPIIYRGGEYNALDNAGVRQAIEATGRKSLAIGGISTDGCVIETAMGALRLGYRVALVEDATAGATRETHDIAVRRMVQAGVVPITWLCLATEFQMDWQRADTAKAYFNLIAEASPGIQAAVEAEHAQADKAKETAHA